MLETLKINEELTFQPLTEEEKTRRGILGRLSGPVASFKSPTRNGRKYSESLWEKVFNASLVKELFSRGGIPGELDHPDRDETCSEKIAIMMPEPPKKDKEGHLVGYFDIIDTPCGKIAAALAKYGFKFGISSRGSGETFTDYDGQESVDPDSYTLNAFDLVLIPACKEAVLNLTESLDTNKFNLKKVLNEALNSSTDDDRKIMEETLTQLEIDYTPNLEEVIEENDSSKTIPEKDYNIEEAVETDVADNNGMEMITELQETLKQNAILETQVKELQEKLSVCYTKESKFSKLLEKAQNEVTTISAKLDEEVAAKQKISEKLDSMRNIISEQNQEIKKLNESLDNQDKEISSLTEKLNTSNSSKIKLNESVTAKNNEINSLKESFEAERASFNKEKEILKKQNAKLNESLDDIKKDSQIIKSQANAKLTKAQQLVEKYKNVAKTAVEKYIASQSVKYGIKVEDIKSRLNENYSFNDIDRVCENLRKIKINMNSLPFNISSQAPVKMRIKESAPISDPVFNSDAGLDDDVDEVLKTFSN